MRVYTWTIFSLAALTFSLSPLPLSLLCLSKKLPHSLLSLPFLLLPSPFLYLFFPPASSPLFPLFLLLLPTSLISPSLPPFFDQNPSLPSSFLFPLISSSQPVSLRLPQCLPGATPDVWLRGESHRRHSPHADPSPRPPHSLVQLPAHGVYPTPEQDDGPTVQGV